MIDVARRSGAPLHVSHLKSLADESLIEPLLELLESAATELDVTFDQYPYGAGSTLLASILPGWAQEGGATGTLRTIGNRDDRRRIALEIANGLPGWENILGTLGPEQIEIANAAAPNEDAVGRTLAEIGAERGSDPVATALDLMSESALDVTMVLHYASDDAVRTIARHPLQLVGSDGIFGSRPHPRLYATAPRFLGRFAIQDGLLPVEEAVARLTARAADRLGLTDRGRIAVGKRADLVLLDPAPLHRHGDLCRSGAITRGRRGRLGERRRRPPRRCPDGRAPWWGGALGEFVQTGRQMALTRIVQLTDLHLYADPDARFYEIPTRELLQDVIAHVEQNAGRVDHLVVTGDHTNDDLAVTYEAVRDILQPWHDRVLVRAREPRGPRHRCARRSPTESPARAPSASTSRSAPATRCASGSTRTCRARCRAHRRRPDRVGRGAARGARPGDGRPLHAPPADPARARVARPDRPRGTRAAAGPHAPRPADPARLLRPRAPRVQPSRRRGDRRDDALDRAPVQPRRRRRREFVQAAPGYRIIELDGDSCVTRVVRLPEARYAPSPAD